MVEHKAVDAPSFGGFGVRGHGGMLRPKVSGYVCISCDRPAQNAMTRGVPLLCGVCWDLLVHFEQMQIAQSQLGGLRLLKRVIDRRRERLAQLERLAEEMQMERML